MSNQAPCVLITSKIARHFDRLDGLARDSASGPPLPQTVLGIKVPDVIIDHAKNCDSCGSLLVDRTDAMVEIAARSSEARRARQRA